MKKTVFNKRLGDIERAIERVDPANRGFTGTGLAEYLNSPYDGPSTTKQGTRGRKLNSRGEWATGAAVSNILRITHYPYVQKKKRRTYFHLGTDTEEMQNKHNERVEQSKNAPRMEEYVEPFIHYWTDDDYGLEDAATEMGVSVPTISVKFRRLEESSAYGHYPVQYKERTGRKRKVTSRKKKKEEQQHG